MCPPTFDMFEEGFLPMMSPDEYFVYLMIHLYVYTVSNSDSCECLCHKCIGVRGGDCMGAAVPPPPPPGFFNGQYHRGKWGNNPAIVIRPY